MPTWIFIQLQSSGTPNDAKWVTEAENFIKAHNSNPNGWLIYWTDTNAEGYSIEDTSPDVSGSLYQQATKADDKSFGQLYSWLKTQNLLGTTTVALGGDEAENDSTPYDNFYGAGSTGMGTTRHEPWMMIGPGVNNQGMAKMDNTEYNSDAVAATLLYAAGLPAPFEARDPAITAWFKQ